MPMNIRILVTLLSALLITSCGTTKLSKKDISAFDAGKKAIVRTYNQPIVATMIFEEMPVARIRAVDGKDVDTELFNLDDQIVVDVGLHEIEFSCQARGGYDERDFSEIIKLDLKPHHEYLVRCSFDSFGSDFSVKEKRVK
jgi:hypothetical protein